MPFITLAARFKAWTDEDLKLLREKVRERPGRVDAIWHEMGDQSDKLLLQAVKIAQEVFATYADRVLPINGVAADTIQ